jgi:2-dehydropantoate 2-reductase
MDSIKKISLIGLGAIGCAYASRLYDMDKECLSVIADKGRIVRYKSGGFFINNKKYDFNYIDPKDETDPADLIILSVKYYNLSQAIKDIKNHVGKDTIIISFLNGISSEEIIGKIYGMDKMLYAMCIGIDATRVKNRVVFSSTGKVTFGEKTNDIYSKKVTLVRDLFDRAGIPYEIPEDMIRALWWKFMVNVGINQASAVLRAPYGVFKTVTEANELMESAMREVIEISKKTGINLNEEDIKKWHKVIDGLNDENKTSMLQDMEAERKTEVDAFAGAVCELGVKYNVATPVNKTLYNIIKSIESSRYLKL